MRKPVAFVSVLAATAALLAASPSSHAADFSGVSIGIGLGGLFSSVDFDHVERNNAGVELNRQTFSVSPSAFAGGIHGGYHHQFGAFLFGVEGSYIAFTAEDQQRTNLNNFPRNREAQIRNQFGVAARLGYVFGDWLAYGKAGMAVSDLEFHNYRVDTGADLGLSKEKERGFLFGAGFEFSINRNWSLGLDYTGVRYDVDNTHMRSPVTGQVFTTSNDNIDFVSHLVLGRLSYRFGGRDREYESLK